MKIGSKAPKFKLPSSDGDTVELASFAGKYVVLFFYPRDSTPGCTREAIAFRDQKKKLAALGAVVLGVSRDSIASHCKFRDAQGLNFPLLSDPETKVIEAYGAWGEKVLYGKKSLGIIRSTVVIGPDGKVVAHFPKVKVDGHADAVIAAIEADRA
jgi:thioredoxin-dependent peroxiredoxin